MARRNKALISAIVNKQFDPFATDNRNIVNEKDKNLSSDRSSSSSSETAGNPLRWEKVPIEELSNT